MAQKRPQTPSTPVVVRVDAQAVQDIQQAAQIDLAWRRAGGPGRVTSRAPQDPRLIRSRIPRHRGELRKARWE